MDILTLELLVKEQEPFIRQTIADTGRLYPFIFIRTDTTDNLLTFDEFTEHEKHAVRLVFETAASLKETNHILFFSEVWISPPLNTDTSRALLEGKRSVSSLPDKREGVLVLAASRSGECIGLWRVVRDDGPVRLGERMMEDVGSWNSRFTKDLKWTPKEE